MTVSFYARGGGVTKLGGSTPLTAIQASQVQMQRALVFFADNDASMLFTHNWGLDASAPTYGDPEIFYYGVAAIEPDGFGQFNYLPLLTFDISNTNVVQVFHVQRSGAVTNEPTFATYWITLRRPHSIGQ